MGRTTRRGSGIRRLTAAALGASALVLLGFAPSAHAVTVSHFQIGNASVTEGNAGTVNLTFTISYTGTRNDISVDWATADGTATAGADYVSGSGTATFTSAGAMSATITVPVNGDTLDEANETLFVNLSNPQPPAIADITTAQGTGTITDDDPTPTLVIDDVTLPEGNSGTSNATFTVTLSAPSGRNVTVNYATANNTATQPADYASTSGSLTFAPGTVTRTIAVPVAGDLLNEIDETFRVNLSGAVNATIADSQGIGTITDDDPIPSISINDPTLTEGNSGTSNMTFTLTLSAASGRTVTVDYATSDNSATQPADYSTRTGTVTFAAGQVTRTFTVPVVGDTLDEFDETFFADLTNPTNATITKSHSVGTITDNDPLPSISTANVTVPEGDSGTSVATFTVTLSAASSKAIAVDFATANGTATAGADYEATSGTLSYAPGDLTKTVDVTIDADLLDEANETFTLNLSNPSNATVATASRTGTITDDDPTPTLVIDDVTLPEGGTISIPVTLSVPSGQTVSVDFATADGTALAGEDYTAASGALVFAPGETTKTVDVLLASDQTYENDETFLVALANPSNAIIATAQATATITNDDPVPTASINDVAIDEGDLGSTPATFSVSLSNPSAFPASVEVATADGTATAPADYGALSTTVVFPPGETAEAIDVAVEGDTTYEADEAFTVDLGNPVGSSVGDPSGLGTIRNDDAAPLLDLADVTVTEGNSGTTTATFTVTLTGDSALPATVDVATTDGTALSSQDFDSVSTTLTFASGQASQTVDVPIHGDTTFESDESFALDLSNPTNATVGDGSASGTILNDDTTPGISVDDPSVTEGDAGQVAASFTVSLGSDSAFPVSVDAWIEPGTATIMADFDAPASATLTFAPGETVQTFDVAILGDIEPERAETFLLHLTNPAGASIGDDTGVGTILDDDAGPPANALSVSDPVVTEGAEAVFSIHLAAPSDDPTSIAYSTYDRSALAGSDYQSTAGTLVLDPGQTEDTIAVPVTDDGLAELDETFVVLLVGNDGSTAGTATILDDDLLPTRLTLRHMAVDRGQIHIGGRLIGVGKGATVRVDLFRRSGGRWVLLDEQLVPARRTHRHTATGASVTSFRTRFANTGPGTYLVRATYDGDATHGSSRVHRRVLV